jgi:hypothetical protein
MKAQRCQCKNITNNKICLNKSKKLFIVNNKKYCKFHMNYYHNNYAIIIQSIYRGYKKRQYLNNIYNKLPYDLQNNILYFIKKDFYIEKLNNKLDLIVNNKINNYIIDFNNKLNTDINVPFSLLTYLSNNVKEVIHIYKLFVKYQSILTYQSILYNNLINNLNKLNVLLYDYENRIFNAYSNHVHQLCYVLYHNLDFILNPNTSLSSVC